MRDEPKTLAGGDGGHAAPDSREPDLRRLMAETLGSTHSHTIELSELPPRSNEDRTEYAISEITALDGEACVRRAYQCILRRDPDEKGGSFWLQLLNEGVLDKVAMVRSLLQSAEAKRHGVRIRGIISEDAGSEPLLHIENPLAPAAGLGNRDTYYVDDFLAFEDGALVESIYRVILGRAPDESGSAALLSALREGRIGRVGAIGVVRYSKEGRRVGVPIRGLWSRYWSEKLRDVRIVGPLLETLDNLLHLGGLRRCVEQSDAALRSVTKQANSRLEQMMLALNRSETRVERELEWLLRRAASVEMLRGSLERRDRAVAALRVELLGQRREQRLRFARLLAAIRTKAERAETDALAAQARQLTGALERSRADAADTYEHLGNKLDSSVSALGKLASALSALDEKLGTSVAALDGKLNASIAGMEAELTSALATLTEKVDESLPAVEARIDSLLPLIEAKAEGTRREMETEFTSALAALAGKIDASLPDVEARINSLVPLVEAKAEGARLEGVRHELEQMQAKVMILLDELGLREDGSPAMMRGGSLDELYLALGDRFRGTREEILHRALMYVPIVREAGAGEPSRPVLDLGSGRGEWLEVLRDNGLSGVGVDFNESLVQLCSERGLQVHVDDALRYLERVAAESLGAITGFHIIEHLPMPRLIQLIDACMRALRPEGILIFETPNPENVVVGACNFYTDPTHNRPLPPVLTQFIVEQRGFADVKLMRLGNLTDGLPGPLPDGHRYAKYNPFVHALRHNFFSPPDYAVIATKPKHE